MTSRSGKALSGLSLVGRYSEQAAFVLAVILAAFFALEPVQPLTTFAGVLSLSVTESLVLLMVGTWGIAHLLRHRTPSRPRAMLAPILAWLAILILSSLLAPTNRADAFKFVGRVLAGILVAWAVYTLARTQRRWMHLVYAVTLCGIIVALFGVFEAAGLAPFADWLTNFKSAPTHVGGLLRVSSTLVYATVASMVLELTLPLAVCCALTNRNKPAAVLLGAGVLLILLAEVLTFTRAGLISIAVTLVFMGAIGIWQCESRLWKASAAALGALLLFMLIAASNPTVRLRLSSVSDASWYRVFYSAPEVVSTTCEATLHVPITLRNAGVRAWNATGTQPFQLSYHVRRADGGLVVLDGLRTPLPYSIGPGASAEIMAAVAGPPSPGEYLIEWDMVQKDVLWFSWRDNPVGKTKLVVPEGSVCGTLQSTALLSDTSAAPPSSPSRLQLWSVALRMVERYPVLGVGPDNFRLVYGPYAGATRWDVAVHANNVYFEWLADTGVVGLLGFLWVVWCLAQSVCVSLKGGGPISKPPMWVLQVGLAGSLVAWFTHGFLDYFYEYTPTYVAFWIIVGLALRYQQLYLAPNPQSELRHANRL